jgi:hypothetical protein
VRSAAVAAVVVLIVTPLVGCGSSTPAAAPVTETVTKTVTAPPSTVTFTVTATPAKPVGEYPKFVDAKSVDRRFTAYTKLTKLVQLAPGVYAEPSATGELGTLEDYTTYFGLCVDTKRYSREHPGTGGGTCW